MRSMFRSVLVALVAVLAVSAVAAASASAEREWLLNGKPVTEPTPVTFTLHQFEMEDKKATGGTVAFTCSAVTGKGTVAPKGAGTLTEFKLAKCWRTKTGACKEQTKGEQESKELVRSLNLPWKTQLKFGIERPLEDWVESTGLENMGWEFECTNILGGKTTDRCTTEYSEEHKTASYQTELKMVGSGEVDQRFAGFLGPTLPLKCSIGGAKAGVVTAEIILKGPEGQKLSYKEE